MVEPKSLKEQASSTTLGGDQEVAEYKSQASDIGEPKPLVKDDFPDGGLRAWLVVLGGAFGTFSTFGLVNSWGVFQAYYELNNLKNMDPSAIAWIGSIQYALFFLPGLLTGRLFDLGWFRLPYGIASALLITSTFLVAECKDYWQYLLCQGIAQGLACGMMFGPMMGVIPHWFKRRRGIAIATAAAGASYGGTIFPIAARRLIPIVGFPWTMRILGFVQLVGVIIANFALARRLPPRNVQGGLLNLKAFKNAAYSVYCLSSLIAYLGLYTVLTYIDVSATSVGIDPEFSFYLVSIANGCSGVGRYVGGALNDRFGAINTMAPLTLVSATLTFAWPFVKTRGGYIAIAVIYGFSSGAYISTFLCPVFDLGDVEDVGRRTGMTLTLVAIGALTGPPISGAIKDATNGYAATGYFAGSVIVLSVSLMVLTKYLALGSIRGKF